MQRKNPFQELQLLSGGLAIGTLALHFYVFCYGAFQEWHFTTIIIDRFGMNLGGPFHHRASSKLIILFFLGLALIGTNGSSELPHRRKLIKQALTAASLYFGSDVLLLLTGSPGALAILYMGTTMTGLILLYLLLQPIAVKLTRYFAASVFNTLNETFPQQEDLLRSPESIHFNAMYRLRNQKRKSIINLDIYTGTLVMGKPGSGKTRYVFRQMIRQSIVNKMALFVYDLKYPSLSRLTYNYYRTFYASSDNPPAFYSINFDDLSRSHRCNPLDPASMPDISDAEEMARTMLFAINRSWIEKQGDFFCDSAIRFFTACMWFLRQYAGGKYCTLPHLIEFIQTPYHVLFSILQTEPLCETRIGSFLVAYQENTPEQLQGQIDSAKIPLTEIASPRLYYLLSANDFTLDINDPVLPKIMCIGSSIQKQYIYGAIVSLYVSRMLKLINHSGGKACHLLLDEFTSFYCPNMAQTVAVGREYRVAITTGIQDISQLRAEYGRNQADALVNLPGNILSGRVTGDSAKFVSNLFPRILQERSTVNTSTRDTSISETRHLDSAVPESTVATLSSGEFVGITADNPNQPNPLKAFHSHIMIDKKAYAAEESSWVDLPVVRKVDQQIIDENYMRIKKEVNSLVSDRLAEMLRNPTLSHLIIPPNGPNRSQKRSR